MNQTERVATLLKIRTELSVVTGIDSSDPEEVLPSINAVPQDYFLALSTSLSFYNKMLEVYGEYQGFQGE